MQIEKHSINFLGPTWLERATALPALAVLTLTLVLIWFSSMVEVSHESRLTTVLLNTLLVTGVSAAGAWLAVRGFLAGGLPELLYAGSGLIAMGASFLIASIAIGEAAGPNEAVTVHNLGVFCASWLHLAAAIHAGQPQAGRLDPGAFKAAGACFGVLAFTGLLWAAARYGLTPVFYIAGKGPTPVRQLLLTLSIALLSISAALLIRHAARRGSLSLRCYGLGLGLIALGLVDVSIAVPGSVLSWAGRVSQGIGHLYLLAAFIVAIRTAVKKGFSVKEAAVSYYLESESHLRALVDTLQLAVITMDSKQRVVLWNHHAETMFGYCHEEAAGRLLTSLIAAAGNEGEALQQTLEERSGRYRELMLRRKDEGETPAEVLVFAAAGVFEKWTNLVVKDISERKRTEQILRRYELISTHSRDIILHLRYDTGRVIEANDAAVAAYGFSRAELLNLTIRDLRAPETLAEAGDQLLEAERKGVLFESIHRRRDGSTFFVEVSSQGATIGGVRTLVSVIRDISERKTAEEAMRKRELRLRQALRVSRSFAFEWNPTTDEVTRSEECGPLLGLQGDEAVHDTGRGFFLRVHPEDRERFFAQLQALTPENPSYITKYRLVRPDGNVLILEETGLGFFDTRQRLSWLTGISTDVTELEMSREEIAYLASFPKLNTNAITEVDLDGQLRFCNPTAERLFPDLVQRGLDHPWLSDWAAVARAFYGRSSDRIEREVAVDGQSYHQTLHFLPESRRIRIYGLDITELKVAEQALHTSEARFRLLAGNAAQLLAAKDPQAQINELAVRVMAHLGCQCFFNFLAVEGPPDRLRLNAWAGIPPEEARRIEWLDYGVAVCGCAARDGARIVAERIPATHDIRTELVKSYGIKAYACHPLLGVNGRVLGTLSFGTRDRETFSAEDLELMEAVADQVAVAMVRMQNERDLLRGADALQQANKELEKKVRQRTCELEDTVASLENEISARKKIQTQLRELSRKSLEALEADRRTVARELHDSIGGSLAAIKFGLEGVAELVPREPVDGGGRLEALISHLADTIKETKRISASLRPLAIDDLGLLATIEWHIRQFCQRYEAIRVVCQIDVEEQEIPEELKIVLYRVMQEALTNVARHSQADAVVIHLTKSAAHFEFEVADNGCGFDVSEAIDRQDSMSGFGLKSMQERTEICGGLLNLTSRPGAGTSVKITLPFDPAASCL